MTELRPCPACGEKAAYFTAGNQRVRCDGPRACMATKWCEATDEAAAIWNSLPRRDDHREITLDMWEQAMERRRIRIDAAVACLPIMAQRGLSTASAAETALHFADALLAELAKDPAP